MIRSTSAGSLLASHRAATRTYDWQILRYLVRTSSAGLGILQLRTGAPIKRQPQRFTFQITLFVDHCHSDPAFTCICGLGKICSSSPRNSRRSTLLSRTNQCSADYIKNIFKRHAKHFSGSLDYYN